MRIPSYLLPLIILALTVIGCSGSAGDPAIPDLNPPKSLVSSSSSDTRLLGLWQVSLDPATATAEIVPLRIAEFTADVTQFMQPPASPQHLLQITIDDALTDWLNGLVVATVSFYHIGLASDTYTGFDVRGVCIGDGSLIGFADPEILYASNDDLRVENADGLTRWFNPSEFTTYETIFGFTLGKLGTPSYDFNATLNGYKYFCDYIDPDESVAGFFSDPGCINPRGYFSAGNQVTRKYEIQFSTPGGVPEYLFQYAIVASWEPPDPDPPEAVPDDFSLSANCAEAYAFSVVDNSTLYFESPGSSGGELILDLTVFDHQGIQNSAGVHEEIARIHLESPEPLINGNLATFESSDLTLALIDTNSLYARYNLVLPEAATDPGSSGVFPILIVVESAFPTEYDSGFPGFDFPSGALAAYYMTDVHVGDINPNLSPVAVADTSSGSYTGYTDVPVEFDGSDSYDPDGFIVSWEWDFDEDAVYGDETGDTASYTWDTEGVYYVDLKVTDDDDAWDTLDDPIEITIVAKVIHVDIDNAGDPLEDGSSAHPFDKLQEGADAVPDGTGWMIYVHEGTYNDALTLENPADPMNSPGGQFLLSGMSNVTLLAEDGVILDPPFNLTYQKAAIRLRSNCQNITIDNFIIDPTYAYQSAIWGDGGSGLTVQNCSLEPPNASYGFLEFLRTQSTANVTAQDNEMDTFNSASTFMSIFVINGGSNVTITRNDVYRFNNWTGYNMGQTSEGYIAMYNVSGGEVSKNKLGGDHHRASPSSNYVQSYGVYIYNGSNITVRNNLIYDTYFRDSSTGDSRNWGIRVIGSASNIEIYNNTLDRVGPPATFGGPGYSHGIRIENINSHTIHSNIVTNITAPTSASAYGIYTNTSQASDYGCVWSINGGVISQLYGGGAYAGTGSINEDPMYNDPDNFDYTLAAGSPCIGTGMSGNDMGCYGGSDPLD